MLRTKLAASALSAVLAVSLCPGFAMADSLAAGEADGAMGSASVVKVQARQSIWVLSGISYTYKSSSSGSTTSYSYSYSGNGLVTNATQYTSYQNSCGYTTSTSTYTKKLAYSGINLKRLTSSYTSSSSSSTSKPTVYTYKCTGGKPVSAATRYSSGNNSNKTNYKYSYNSAGAVKSVTQTSYSYRNDDGSYSKKMKKRSTGVTKYSKISGKKPGQAVSKWSYLDGSKSVSAPTKYTYDKKGNLKRSKYGLGSPTIYSYTYKSGRVASVTRGTSGSTYRYTWKKIDVPAGSVNTVKAQQWSIVNNNLNHAFGPVSLGA